jgi:type IV secretion system protein VirB11
MNQVTPLSQELAKISEALNIPDATDVCFNGIDGVVFVSTSTGFQKVECPLATNQWAEGLRNLVGKHNEVRESAKAGMLEGRVPHARGVLRAAFFSPPITQHDRVVFTIRIPSQHIISFDELLETGFFDDVETESRSFSSGQNVSLSKKEKHLLELITRAKAEVDVRERRLLYREFFLASVAYDQRICLCGGTDTGKTTLAKALVQHIPVTYRMLVLETVLELLFPNHPNVVQLQYDQNEQGSGAIGPMEIINGILRFCPDVVIMGEVRDKETFALVRIIDSGHGGMIFTNHATTVDRVYPVLAAAAGRHPDCKMSQSVLEQFFREQIQVLVSFGKTFDALGMKRRFVQQIKYIHE